VASRSVSNRCKHSGFPAGRIPPDGKDSIGYQEFCYQICYQNSEGEPKAGCPAFASGKLLTVKQVAEVLGVCTATVYTLCDEGALAHIRVRNSIRISEATLAAFMSKK